MAKLALSTAILAGGALSAQAYFGSAPADPGDGQATIQLAQGAGGGGSGGSGGSSGGAGSGTGGSSDSGTSGGSSPGGTQMPVGGTDPRPEPKPGTTPGTTTPGTNNPPSR